MATSKTAAAASKRALSSRDAHQAQKERQEQVTETQSLTLVKNLVRVSVSTVCSLRGIFPSSCFQERTYAGMKIFQLDAATRDTESNETVVKNQEAYDLTMWLESGVFEAVEKRYLRRMEFIITSPGHSNPREAYAFDLTYPEDPRDGAVVFSGTRVTTAASTKGQLVKLIRSLIAFGHTLEELPRERVLNIKLWYYDDRTPAGWQPKFFREADPQELKFSKVDQESGNKIKIQIGDLKTPHHTLSLRFTGYDNPEQQQDHQQPEGPAAAAAADGSDYEDDTDSSQDEGRWSKQGSLLTCTTGPEEVDGSSDVGNDDVNGGYEEGGERDVSGMVSGLSKLDVSTDGSSDADTIGNDGRDGHELRSADSVAQYDAAKAWAATQDRPTITALTQKMGISKSLAKEFLNRLVLEGFFVKRNFRYHRCLDPPEACQSSQVLPQDEMDVDTDANHRDGVDRSSSQGSSSSFSDGSETQAPEELDRRQEQLPVSMPMPPPPAPGRRQRHTPEARSSSHGSDGRDYTTPPVPGSSAHLKPVREKPQRAKMVTMGTKRVLDDSALSGHSGYDNDSAGRSTEEKNSMREEDEPIDVFNPDDLGSETGYERMVLSQVSTTSTSRPKRKCSLAINPIYQSVPSKRLHVDEENEQ